MPEPSKTQVRAQQMVAAVKSYAARALQARIGPLELRIKELEARLAAVERGGDERLRAVK